jgi:hypothetical protein
LKNSLLLGLCLFGLSSAQATAVFVTGNSSQDSNVLYHVSCGGCIAGPATTVIGHTQNGTIGDVLVDIQNTDNPLVNLTFSGAQQITYSGGTGFSNVNVYVPGYFITGVMFQLTSTQVALDGTVTFTANTNTGPQVTSGLAFSHQGGGLNQYTMNVTGGTLVSSIDVSTSVQMHDISQIDITLQAVPEPGTIGMVGAGLAALAFYARRRRR